MTVAEAGGGFGASLSRWRDTCAALGAGTVEEPATSPPGVGTAGKDRGATGAGPCGLAGVCLPDKWLFNVQQEKGSLQTNTIC